MNRRDLLALAVKGAGGVMAGVMAAPLVIHALSPALRRSPAELWHPIGPVENFPTGQIVASSVTVAQDAGSMNRKGVFVWKKDDSSFIVYSRSCTDLGCPLHYDAGSRWFFCPCHGGIFDTDGERRAGPPKKPMWRFENRIRDGVLEIDLRSVPPMA